MTEAISQELRRCSRCTSIILLEIYFSKNRKGEYNKTCDKCRLQGNESTKKWREKNKEKVAAYKKKYAIENKEQISEKGKIYYAENKDKIDEYRAKNKEKIVATSKKYNADKRRHCEHNINRLRCKICCPNGYLKALVSCRIHDALKSTKSKKSIEYLGCDIQTFRTHIEKSFKENMTWDNHGFGDDCWNIDHIIPILYKQDNIEPSIEEVGKRLHYLNTQAMWQLENFSKGNRFIE